jgi:methyltransferase (TIGR00027 family)
MPAQFNHVADTAFWIAGFRAQETERPDAAFKDPLAKKLAGERGIEMVANTPRSVEMAFAMVVRTTSIDRLVEMAITRGVDTVINLGAGLDTRPYRLRLPAGLKWIEVDFADIINYKNSLLADEKPVCKLERIIADLSDDLERKKLFTELGSQTQKALVITEGLIAYLNNDAASQLSKAIFAVPSFKYWIQNYGQGRFRKQGHAQEKATLLKNTPFIFDVSDPISFFKKDGWQVSENIYILDEADRIGRKLPLKFPLSLAIRLFSKWIRETGNKTYGCVMLGK